MIRIFLSFILSLFLSFGISSSAYAGGSEMAKQVVMMAAPVIITNATMGGSFLKVCSTPTGQWACPIGAGLLMAAVMAGGTKDSANEAAQQLDYSSGYDSFGDLGSISYAGKNYTPNDIKNLQLKAMEDLKKMEAMGYKANPDGTIETPNGALDGSTMSSGSAMAKGGFIGGDMVEEYDEALEKVKAEANKVSVVSMPAGGGGGGGRGSSRAAYKSPYDDFNFNLGGGRKPAAAKTKGLTKNFGGDPVGTSTDNIFDMLHRNYQKKVLEREFIQ